MEPELHLSVDMSGKIAPPSKRRCMGNTHDSHMVGPSGASEMHSWNKHLAFHMPPPLIEALRTPSGGEPLKIIMTTSYSGIGSAEWGAEMVAEAIVSSF